MEVNQFCGLSEKEINLKKPKLLLNFVYISWQMNCSKNKKLQHAIYIMIKTISKGNFSNFWETSAA